MEEIIKLSFRGRKAFPEGTMRNYGKYGEYKKVGKAWVRIKNGYPLFRKTLDYRKMKEFLLMKGYPEKYFESRGVKTLRTIINRKFGKEYNDHIGRKNGLQQTEKI